MGGTMSKVLPGLYVGNFRDSKDKELLETNKITHILSIHDNAKPLLDDKQYLCIVASDTPSQDLIRFFPECIEFIHKARLEGGGVLVHCLAGVSRSVTVTAAYIMTVTNLGWRDAINAIRGARNLANPNFGFQRQLQVYENEGLEEARRKLREKYPNSPFNDQEDCRHLLRCFRHYLDTGEATTSTFVPPAESQASTANVNDGLYSLPYNAYKASPEKTKDMQD